MKKKLLLLCSFLLSSLLTSAHDFAVANSDGVTIYYTITSEVYPRTVSVAKQSGYVNVASYSAASINIPATVTDQSYTYTVTGIMGGTSSAPGAFYNCKNLTSITLPSTITSIGAYSFTGCSKLTSINIPSSVTAIGEGAFYECKALESITIPNGVTAIEKVTFRNCYNLSSVNFGNSVTTIGEQAFYSTNLSTLNLPTSLTRIDDSAFSGNSSLTQVVLPNNLTSIGSYAFMNCSNLVSVTFPASLQTLGSNIFSSCSNLTTFNGPNVLADGRSLVIDGNLVLLNFNGITEYVAPDEITSFEAAVFESDNPLTRIELGENITSIPASAFSRNYNLQTLILRGDITEIGLYAFDYCSNLSAIYLYSSIVPSVQTKTFKDFTNRLSCDVYVLNGAREAYTSVSTWNVLRSIIEMPIAKVFDGNEYSRTESVDNLEIIYTRTFNNTAWQPLYVPFAMSYEEWSQDLDIAELAGVHMYEDGTTKIEFLTVTKDQILPNVPYVVRAKEEGTVTLNLQDKTLHAAPAEGTKFVSCGSPRWTYKLIGNYQGKTKDELDGMGAFVMGGGCFSNALADLKPCRFYLTKEHSANGYWGAPARNEEVIQIMVDGVLLSNPEATGILNVTSGGNGDAYNLNGVKVGTGYKGIVIKNGKKFLNF